MTHPESVPEAPEQGGPELSLAEFELAGARLANGDLIGSNDKVPMTTNPLTRTLRAILADPGSNRLPEALLPRLCWRERLTVYSAGDKSGKSTLVTAAVAAFTSGRPFLGELCGPGTVLWAMLEEHVSDLAARAQRFGAHPDRLHVMELPADPRADLRDAVESLRPDLVVVDTLIRYAGEAVRDSGQSAQWSPIMADLLQVARAGGAGVIALHHACKKTGRSRDSGEITAAADVVVEQLERHKGGKQSLSVRGRWALEDFTVVLAGNEYALDGAGAAPAAVRIVEFLRTHPDVSTTVLRNGVGGATRATGAALADLLRQGIVIDQGTDDHHRYQLATGAPSEIVVSQSGSQAESPAHLTPATLESQGVVRVESGFESGVHLTPPQTHRVEESGRSGELERTAFGKSLRRSLRATSTRGTWPSR